ncbi:MAG TPA: hypothetical protein VJW20_00025 [Candidatus Angelobacter sp.]|nr:hypothetical protein [Candidatus Angelobacter sp.]
MKELTLNVVCEPAPLELVLLEFEELPMLLFELGDAELLVPVTFMV